MIKFTALSLLIMSVLLIFSGVRLVIVNLHLGQRTLSLRDERQSMQLPGGVLVGFDARNNSKWEIGDDGIGDNQGKLYTVLFRASDSAASRDHWSMIAANARVLSKELGLEMGFVGVCDHFASCADPTAPNGLTLLSFAGLSQMHALAYAEPSDLAFLVQGGTLVASLDMGDDPEDMASKIIDHVLDATRPIDRNISGLSP